MVRSVFLSLFALTVSSGAAAALPESTTLRGNYLQGERKLSLERIVGYEPRSQVTDHAAIDLDQKSMEEELFLERMIKARTVYVEGGHSRSYADVVLIKPVGPISLKLGDPVLGTSASGGEVSGRLMENLMIGEGNIDNIKVKIQYTTSDIQASYVGCQVGGLYTFSEANRVGCFNDTGSMVFVEQGKLPSQGKKYSYTYDPRLDNNNARTLQSFSTTAKNIMHKGGNPTNGYTSDFQKFALYYSDTEYADKWIIGANQGINVVYSSGRGNAEFAKLTYLQANAEAMAKGTVALNIFMYVIHMLETAVSDCEKKCPTCATDEVHAVDQAVAFYAGSLEGPEGNGEGRLLYDLADRRALNFKTTGELSDDDEGTSYVNTMIVREFKKMQIYVLQSDCASASQSKTTIVNLMKVPLVQSVLRYAYIRDYENPSIPEDSQQAMAEGATYAAAILPYVWACNQDDATVIYDNMRIGSVPDEVSFTTVKSAFERNYQCLGVTCTQVGGVWTVKGYAEYAEMCQDSSAITAETDAQTQAGKLEEAPVAHNGGLIAGSVVVIMVGFGLLIFAYVNMPKGNPGKDANRRTSNIAAVSEIS